MVSRLYVGVHQPMPGDPYDPTLVLVRTERHDPWFGKKFCRPVALGSPLLAELADEDLHFHFDLDEIAKTAFNLGREYEAAERMNARREKK